MVAVGLFALTAGCGSGSTPAPVTAAKTYKEVTQLPASIQGAWAAGQHGAAVKNGPRFNTTKVSGKTNVVRITGWSQYPCPTQIVHGRLPDAVGVFNTATSDPRSGATGHLALVLFPTDRDATTAYSALSLHPTVCHRVNKVKVTLHPGAQPSVPASATGVTITNRSGTYNQGHRVVTAFQVRFVRSGNAVVAIDVAQPAKGQRGSGMLTAVLTRLQAQASSVLTAHGYAPLR